MAEDLLVVVVNPPADYLPTYLDYVTAAGCNKPEKYFGQCDNPDMRVPIAASLMVGRACELARLGLDDIADRKLDKVHNRLIEFRQNGSRHNLDVARTTSLIDGIALVVRARNDPERLGRAYTKMHAGIVRDVDRLRQKSSDLRRNNRRMGRNDLAGPAQLYTGLYGEQVALAACTGSKGVLVMPTLLHHDFTGDSAESHDMVMIAQQEWPRPDTGIGDVSARPFITRKIQMKSYCLALCPTKARVKGAQNRLGQTRARYYDDIILGSTHCDIDLPGIGLDETATLLSNEPRLYPKERLELYNTVRDFVGRLLNPQDRRLGKISTAFRTARLVVGEQAELAATSG
jgi:hypothetical protein